MASGTTAADGSSSVPNQFVKLPDPTSGAFTESDVRSYLKKWDLAANAQVYRFRYTKPFHKMDPEGFLKDFFNSDAAKEHFQVMGAKGEWKGIGGGDGAAGKKCVKVAHEIVPCSSVSMGFFDKLYDAEEPAIVREGTEFLMKCVDDVVDGFPVADALRECLLKEESEHFEVFTPEERGEFVFRVMQHCCLGGAMCQFEDHMDTYLDVTKRLYKALVAAKKDKTTGPEEPER
eukprot:CAMPEP_0197605684 /NCGR_PEP_ID=MMETSP1326-20131121/43596_1 /TAXON_ID=1155430 /ORGANISM="Genus nov. species nov., Strain RCC2288" /LENGTH=231 /DNA_ID=CAMNT_0043173511 /DNA_START=84 /DNA_END=776 /DNA_ORIENTATION=+